LISVEFADPQPQLGLRVVPGFSQFEQFNVIPRENYGGYRAGHLHACRGTHEQDEQIAFDAVHEGYGFPLPHIVLHLGQDASLGSHDVIEHSKRRPRTRLTTQAKLSRAPCREVV
jgi:hypothetical protein